MEQQLANGADLQPGQLGSAFRPDSVKFSHRGLQSDQLSGGH